MHLNLKTAKKIAGDKDSSTFRTKEGHEFKVQHRALSPGMRKEIAALPYQQKDDKPQENPKLEQSDVKPRKMAEGGPVDITTSGDPIVRAVKGKAPDSDTREGEGWSSKSTQSPKTEDADDISAQAKAFNAQTAPTSDVQRFAEGSTEAPVQDTPEKIAADAQEQAAPPSQAPVTINIGGPQPGQGAAQDAPPQGSPVPAAEAGQQAAGSIKSLLPLLAGSQAAALATAATHPIPQSALDYGQGLRAGFTGEQLPQESPQGLAGGPSPASTPDAGLAAPGASNGTPGGAPNPYQSALQEQVKGLEMGEKAAETAAKGKEAALGDYNKAQAEAANTYDANVKDAMALRQDALKGLQDGKIDPDRYWHNKSTGGKIGSILGILVAGFNPTHNPNAAIDMLNREIDRDIDSQKADLGRKQNLLSAANDHFKNIQSAADFHRVMANDLVSHKIDEALAKAGTPAAQAELLKARGALKFDSEIRMAQIGAMQTLNGQASPDEQTKALNTLRLVAPDKAKEYESRIIPGVGTATVPVPENKRTAFAAGATFMGQMDALEKFRQAHKGTVLDRGVVDEGHRLAELARNSFRIAQGEGVFKEGSAKFNERLIPDPTDFDFFNKNKNAYADMKSQAAAEVQNSSKVYGIKPAGNSMFAEGANLSPQEKSFLDFARANPKDPRSSMILKKFGISK